MLSHHIIAALGLTTTADDPPAFSLKVSADGLDDLRLGEHLSSAPIKTNRIERTWSCIQPLFEAASYLHACDLSPVQAGAPFGRTYSLRAIATKISSCQSEKVVVSYCFLGRKESGERETKAASGC